MDQRKLAELLERVKSGDCEVEDALKKFRGWPAEDLGFACLDHHRGLRTGIPEVVYGETKSPEQIIVIMRRFLTSSGVSLVTRVNPEKAGLVRRELPDLVYHPEAGMLVGNSPGHLEDEYRGKVMVVAAGTSDIPVAEEARVTAAALGNPVKQLYDVGVAGIHRVLRRRDLLEEAVVLIVVAGMEGALPGVIGGVVSRPVIAVPTSVGYGTGFGGIAALLGMLNTCVPGVAVVNIDNGFGAGCLATLINRK